MYPCGSKGKAKKLNEYVQMIHKKSCYFCNQYLARRIRAVSMSSASKDNDENAGAEAGIQSNSSSYTLLPLARVEEIIESKRSVTLPLWLKLCTPPVAARNSLADADDEGPSISKPAAFSSSLVIVVLFVSPFPALSSSTNPYQYHITIICSATHWSIVR